MPALSYSPRRSAAGLFVLVFSAALTACTGGRTALFEGEAKPEWKEAELELPSMPAEKDLIPFQVSPGASAAFYIDARSLKLGNDGIVRYTLLVRAAGGAENLSYEGMRCETAERKLYAIGRGSSEWVLPRNAEWQRISDNSLNRQHAVLAKEFFCLPGDILPTRDEILGLLRNAASLR